MANIKIAQLTSQTTLSDTDTVIVETGTSTNKMSVLKLKELLGIQSGGVIASGSTEFGHYIKFADGTLICHGKIRNNNGLTTQDGILYKGEVITINYPHTFVGAIPTVTATLERVDRVGAVQIHSAGLSQLIFQGYVFNSPIGATYRHDINYITVGRWK